MLSKTREKLNIISRFTVAISTEQGVMQNAAERLLGVKVNEIQDLAQDIIYGQIRLIIATMTLEEIETDRDKFLETLCLAIENQIRQIGLRLISVNLEDITDNN